MATAWRERAAIEFDEQAANVMLRFGRPSAGITFARSSAHKRDDKVLARERLFRWLSAWGNPRRLPLRVLTMPGLHWYFENALCGIEKIGLKRRFAGPLRITAIERERSIYLASLKFMPGARGGISTFGDALRTDAIEAFYCTDFHAFARENRDCFDFAWLDFNGQITGKKIASIAALWPRVDWLLAITILNGRHHSAEFGNIKRWGSTGRWIESLLPGAKLCDEYDYGHPEMKQIILQKRHICKAEEWICGR